MAEDTWEKDDNGISSWVIDIVRTLWFFEPSPDRLIPWDSSWCLKPVNNSSSLMMCCSFPHKQNKKNGNKKEVNKTKENRQLVCGHLLQVKATHLSNRLELQHHLVPRCSCFLNKKELLLQAIKMTFACTHPWWQRPLNALTSPLAYTTCGEEQT